MALPHSSDFYEELSGHYETGKGKLIEAWRTAKALLDALKVEVTQKKGRAFESYTLDTLVPAVPSRIVESVNRVMQKHNRACDEFEVRVRQARERLENDLVAETLEDFNRLVNAENNVQSDVARASSNAERFAEQIKELERDITEEQRPADELSIGIYTDI